MEITGNEVYKDADKTISAKKHFEWLRKRLVRKRGIEKTQIVLRRLKTQGVTLQRLFIAPYLQSSKDRKRGNIQKK